MDTFERLRAQIIAASDTQPSNVFNSYSDLWRRILNERRDSIATADLSAFLSAKSSQASGTIGRTEETRAFAAFYEDLIPRTISDAHPVSPVGAPDTFPFRGSDASVSHLDKLALLAILTDWVPAFDGDVVEIGAGYGALARLILRSGQVRSYTCVDLPENLINTAYFLSRNFPDVPIRVGSTDQGGINLVLAGDIGVIDHQRFDLAINTDSLGEMMKPTTQAYVGWLREHLRPAGLFFSKNGHRRGIGHVERVSEYGYQQFGLQRLRPPVDASTLFDDFSHLVLLGPGAMPPAQMAQVDTLADLYALGLHTELVETSERVARARPEADDVEFLARAAQCFRAERVDDKVAALTPAGRYASCARYMQGIALGTAHRHREAAPLLHAYLADARSFVAEAYCNLLLSFRDRRFEYVARNGAASRYFTRELHRLNALPWGLRELAYRVRIDNMRKKITAPEHWRDGTVTQLKNLVFNLREGKGVSLVR